MAAGVYSSPKLEELLNWSRVAEVNKMLDEGVSPSQVCKWINKNGFKISAPMVYEYKDKRKQAIAQGVQIESTINPINKQAIAHADTVSFKNAVNGVRNELDVLDDLIDRGYKTIQDMHDVPISPQLMMKAIELKNKITEGGHEHLTKYGIEEIKALEQGKFQAVLSAMLQFIPEDMRENAINAIEVAEDSYYRDTDYYEEYLKAKEQSELQEVGEEMENENDENNGQE